MILNKKNKIPLLRGAESGALPGCVKGYEFLHYAREVRF